MTAGDLVLELIKLIKQGAISEDAEVFIETYDEEYKINEVIPGLSIKRVNLH